MLEHLLKSVSICLPLGSEVWQVVACLHSEKFPTNKHDAAKLKFKYYEIANKKPSTGNPELGVVEKSAKKNKGADKCQVWCQTMLTLTMSLRQVW